MPYPFRDKTLQFQTLRALGCANHGGADANEIFELCRRVREGNLQDWFREWRDAGQRAFRLGEESEKLRNLVSAKEAFLRASNYLRTAEFFRRDDPAEDKDALAVYDQSQEAFHRAMKASPDFAFKRFDIPFEEGIKLPAYLVAPAGSPSPRPTILTNGGYDGTKEEAFFGFGAAALARGYAYVGFDGPGQGEVIRRQRIAFRPDWYRVVTTVLDALLARQDPAVDPTKIILVGISFGGWLAAKALTQEHRFAAAVLDDGVYDFAASWRKRVPWFVWSLLTRGQNSLVSFLVSVGVRIDIGRKWGYQNGLWTFGVRNGAELLSTAQQYALTEETVRQIDTPLLILDPQADHLLGGQPSELIRRLGSDQDFHHVTFETRFGAGEHCEKGAQSELDRVIHNWLATKFSKPQ